MESNQMNLGTTKGFSFADLRSKFYAKPLTVGEHTLKIHKLDLSNPILNEKGTRETVLLTAQADAETHVREKEISAYDVNNLLEEAIKRYPEQLGNSSPDKVIETLIASGLEIKFWYVQNPDSPQFYNWNFREPMLVKEAVSAPTAVTSALT